jgi:UDP-N-acetylglucosamine--N-acetylmuramyl-(pentapeptide) pyrophosphoryl-undecaprenol N-acetylglucosamine transferase
MWGRSKTQGQNGPGEVLIAAGGTGGHLYPGLALAQEFRRAYEVQVRFITTPKPVTLDILRQFDFPWETLTAPALQGQGWGRRLLTLLRLPFSIGQAVRLLRRLRPQLVVGMGGYVTGPVGLAAKRLGIPLVIHEQNAVMGAANRYLGRWADIIFLTFPETAGNPAAARSVWSGNPIRPEFAAPQATPRPEQPFTLLIMGGSQGAHQLNIQMAAALPRLAAYGEGLRCIHLAGAADADMVAAAYAKAGLGAQVLPFSPRVQEFMHQAHLVLCRAGASTLAELTALGRVGILVPYPFAAHQHQEKNALYLQEARAAFLIRNEELTGEKIAAMIEQLLSHRALLHQMEENSRALGRPQAAAIIAATCKKYLSAG